MNATILHFKQPPLSMTEIEAFIAIRSPYPLADVWRDERGVYAILCRCDADHASDAMAFSDFYIPAVEIADARYPLAVLAEYVDLAVKRLAAMEAE